MREKRNIFAKNHKNAAQFQKTKLFSLHVDLFSLLQGIKFQENEDDKKEQHAEKMMKKNFKMKDASKP